MNLQDFDKSTLIAENDYKAKLYLVQWGNSKTLGQTYYYLWYIDINKNGFRVYDAYTDAKQAISEANIAISDNLLKYLCNDHIIEKYRKRYVEVSDKQLLAIDKIVDKIVDLIKMSQDLESLGILKECEELYTLKLLSNNLHGKSNHKF